MSKAKEVTDFLFSTFDDYFKEDNCELDEMDKLELELQKQLILGQIIKEEKSEKDLDFVLNNKELYKRLIHAILNDDKKELLTVSVEMMKLLNEEREKKNE